MNFDQYRPLVSQVLTLVAGVLVSRGLLAAELAPQLIGVGIGIVSLAWSIWETRRSSMIARVASLKDVRGVIVDAATARKIPAENVVSKPSDLTMHG